jgi:hypothetical protein
MRLLAALLVLVGVSTARAEGPGTRIGGIFGRSEPVGSLGSRYNLGWTFGLEAGWMPTWAGFVWAVTYNTYSASDARDPVQSLTMWDFGFAFRGQALVRRTGLPVSIYGQVGPALLRASTALPPDNENTFFGPKLGVGVEARLAAWFFGVQADYGLLAGGPSQLQIVTRFGTGMF